MKIPGPQRLRCPHCQERTSLPAPPAGALFHCPACGWYSELAAARDPEPVTSPGVQMDPDAIFEQICAAPADDGPRRALADLLKDRGDPRGQFIALQLDVASGKDDPQTQAKLEVLQREHADGWLPPGVKRETAVFHRGFPHDLEWIAETDRDHPAWRTVDTLRCRLDAPKSSVLAHARPLLRAVRGVSGPLLSQLISIRPTALEELEAHVTLAELGQLARQLEHFPRLKALAVQFERFELGSRHLVELLTRYRALSQLTLPMPRMPMAELLRQREQLAPGIRLHLVLAEGRLVLELGPRSVRVRTLAEGAAAPLDALLATLKAAGVDEVTCLPLPRGER